MPTDNPPIDPYEQFLECVLAECGTAITREQLEAIICVANSFPGAGNTRDKLVDAATILQAANTVNIPLGIDLALGNIAGYEYIVLSGRNSDVDIATAPEDLIGEGGLYNGFEQSVGKVEVISTDLIQDLPPAGDGMHQVRIYGLKTNLSTDIETEDINVGSQSTDDWWRVHKFEGIDYGSDQTNAGTTRVRRVTYPARILATMLPGMGVSHDAIFTVPKGKRAAITDKILTIGRDSSGDAGGTITLRTKYAGGGPPDPGWNAVRVYDFTNESPITGAGDVVVVEEQTDILWRCDRITADNCSPTITFPIVLVSA